jgi:hypothetical protein
MRLAGLAVLSLAVRLLTKRRLTGLTRLTGLPAILPGAAALLLT